MGHYSKHGEIKVMTHDTRQAATHQVFRGSHARGSRWKLAIALALLCVCCFQRAEASACELVGRYCTSMQQTYLQLCRKFQSSPFVAYGDYPLHLHLNAETSETRRTSTCSTSVTKLCVQGIDCCTAWQENNYPAMSKDLKACIARYVDA